MWNEQRTLRAALIDTYVTQISNALLYKWNLILPGYPYLITYQAQPGRGHDRRSRSEGGVIARFVRRITLTRLGVIRRFVRTITVRRRSHSARPAGVLALGASRHLVGRR